jgi:hypothetical protein
VASLKETSSDWEHMAQTDPLWAVCTELGPQGGSYDELGRFWQSGQRDIEAAVSHVEACGLRIDRDGEALDFGCGLGRVNQPLAEVFARCTGVDVSTDAGVGTRLQSEPRSSDLYFERAG